MIVLGLSVNFEIEVREIPRFSAQLISIVIPAKNIFPPCGFTCTLLALLRKQFIINGAGEGNRTLVAIPSSTVTSEQGQFPPDCHLSD